MQHCLQDSQDKLLHHQRSEIRDFFEEALYEDSAQDNTTLSWDSDESIFLCSISNSLDSDMGSGSTAIYGFLKNAEIIN